MKDGLKVGQIVFVRPIANMTRWLTGDILNHIKEVEVEKIGNKYFYLKGYQRKKFCIERMCDISEYSADYQVYFNKQDIKDEIETRNLQWEIKELFSQFGTSKLSLEQLRRIKSIIEEEV